MSIILAFLSGVNLTLAVDHIGRREWGWAAFHGLLVLLLFMEAVQA